MGKFISLIKDDQIHDQVSLPDGITDQQIIDLEDMLRKHNLLPENVELAVTTDIDVFPADTT